MTKLMCCDRAKTAGKIQIISDQTPYVDGLIWYEIHEKVLEAIVQFRDLWFEFAFYPTEDSFRDSWFEFAFYPRGKKQINVDGWEGSRTMSR